MAMDATQLGIFEQACAELQNGDATARQAAEEMLMQMRTSEHAVAVAAAAVQGAASSGAKFQAMEDLHAGSIGRRVWRWAGALPPRAVCATTSHAMTHIRARALVG